jgi:hypothetical protein
MIEVEAGRDGADRAGEGPDVGADSVAEMAESGEIESSVAMGVQPPDPEPAAVVEDTDARPKALGFGAATIEIWGKVSSHSPP